MNELTEFILKENDIISIFVPNKILNQSDKIDDSITEMLKFYGFDFYGNHETENNSFAESIKHNNQIKLYIQNELKKLSEDIEKTNKIIAFLRTKTNHENTLCHTYYLKDNVSMFPLTDEEIYLLQNDSQNPKLNYLNKLQCIHFDLSSYKEQTIKECIFHNIENKNSLVYYCSVFKNIEFLCNEINDIIMNEKKQQTEEKISTSESLTLS